MTRYKDKSVQVTTWLLDSWHRLHHACRVNGSVGRCLYWCHFPMVASIFSSVQLPFIYMNLSAILVIIC